MGYLIMERHRSKSPGGNIMICRFLKTFYQNFHTGKYLQLIALIFHMKKLRQSYIFPSANEFLSSLPLLVEREILCFIFFGISKFQFLGSHLCLSLIFFLPLFLTNLKVDCEPLRKFSALSFSLLSCFYSLLFAEHFLSHQ